MIENKKRNLRRSVQGLVSSDKMDKTITVNVSRSVRHPKYGKFVRHTAKVHAHDLNNDANIGDLVEIIETRKLAKTKCWRLAKIVRRAR